MNEGAMQDRAGTAQRCWKEHPHAGRHMGWSLEIVAEWAREIASRKCAVCQRTEAGHAGLIHEFVQ